MSSDFKSQKLREVIELVIDNRGKNPKEYSSTGIPVIDNYLITSDGQVNLDEVNRFIDENTYNSFLRKYIKHGDVLMTLVGNGYGKVAITPKEKCAIIQNTVGFRCNNDNSNKFLYYLLRTNREIFMNLNRGAAQPSIKVGDILDLEFQFPSKTNQENISSILAALDDHIALLRETNQTLEAIAQALFKSWFVDFDPVRAKAEGRLPEGIDPATAALFPDAFEETELGMLPTGWQVVPFLDVCDLQGGSQPPAAVFIDELKDGYVRLLQIRDFSTDSHKTYIPDTNKLKKVTEDDVLIGRYGSASGDKAKDSLGRVCRGLSGSYNVALMKLNPLLVGREFALQLVNDPRFYNYLQGVSSKAVQSGFSKSELAQYRIVLPSNEILLKFEQFGVAAWENIKARKQKIETLTNLRDTLLPRLISGQLRIADAEAELEKTAA